MEKKYQCECCRQVKSEHEFYRDERRAFGLKLDACKQCKHKKYLEQKEKKIKYQQQWNTENYHKVREYMARYQHRKSNYVTA